MIINRLINKYFSRSFYLFLSFSLLVAPLPISAIAEDIVIHLSNLEVAVLAENPHLSYIHFDKNLSDITRIISEINELDKNLNSPIRTLNQHISSGFSYAEYSTVLEALEYAEKFLHNNSSAVSRDLLIEDLDEVIDKVIDGELTIQFDDLEGNSDGTILRAPTRSIRGNLYVSGKTKLKKHVRVSQGVHMSGKLQVGKTSLFQDNATFEENVTVQGDASINNLSVTNLSVDSADIQNLTLTGSLSFTDLSVVDQTISGTLSVNDLVVENCIDDLCVNTLSVIDQSISGTLSVDDAVIQNLTFSGSLVITDLTLTTLSVTDEVVNGTITIPSFTPAGVVHNNASGLLSSSLIVNADVSASAAIVDTKLATISTAGKVANSATTATSSDGANTIVLRDALGNFATNMITLNGTVTNPTDAATKAYVDAQIGDPGTNLNTPNTLVRRDGTGSFAAQVVSVVDGVVSNSLIVTPFTPAGVVHNNASGLLSSSLIVNADVNPAAGIVDTKLATISTAGKVANSATTATSANTANTIVLRNALGDFSAGTITANLSGNATTATTATTAINFSGALAGDVTGTQGATVVSLVGGQTAADVATATTLANAATAANTANTIVRRNALGDFSATTITANLSGNATTATTATNFSGSLSGEVTGTQGATVVTNAVSANTASAIVRRTATGSFSAGAVSVVDEVVSNSLTVTPFTTAGVVHNDANGLLSSSLIVNADIDPAAGIVDTKLATISTAGKVANSATTATSTNTPNTIALRDGSGNFSANQLSVVDQSISGTLSVNDEVINDFLRFIDTAGGEYIGLQAPSVVPTSYTLSLPSTIPTANQVLRANAITPTDLEWFSEGGSVTPVSSKTIYVAKYGNDITGDGSFNAPYASLSKAISIANGIASGVNPITIYIGSGIYVEDNSSGPLTITATGISIVGQSSSSVLIIPNTPANDLLLINSSAHISTITFQSPAPLATGISVTAGSLSVFNNVRIFNFLVGLNYTGTTSDSYGLNSCLLVNNGTAININNAFVQANTVTIFGVSSITGPAANNGVNITGADARLLINGGVCGLCTTAFTIDGNSTVTISNVGFRLNSFDVVQSGASYMALSACTFELTNSSSDVDIDVSGAGTIAEIIGCELNGNSLADLPQGTGIRITDNAFVSMNSISMRNYDTAIELGVPADTSSTVLTTSAVVLRSNTTDIVQDGSTTLQFNSSTASNSKISIADATNIQMAFFDLDDNGSLAIGSTDDTDTVLMQANIASTNQPVIDYKSSLYSTQAIGFDNLLTNPSSWFMLSQDNANLTSITSDRTKVAGIRLVSDTGSPVGGTSALRGWDINKIGSTAALTFDYQNSDIVGQSSVPLYTVMQLDGVNNQLQLPAVGTQLVFAGDTNLYRSSANVLQTDDNFIVGTLTPSRVVTTNASNQLASSAVTTTELGFLSGVTSSVQTQLNGKVNKSGDIMTGTLQLPAGTMAAPSLVFTGSTTTGLSAPVANTLSFSTNATERMRVSSAGVVSINGFTTTGVVHNDSSGNLSSSLIVDGDITNATISNAKLATISSSNNSSNIVVRDGSGNFATNMITLAGAVTNPTDAATKSYVDSAISTGIVAKDPAVVVSVTNETLSGLPTIDGVVLVANDRVLLTEQTDPVENGLWLAQTGAWTRPADFDTGNTAGQAYVLILSGTIYTGSSWLCNTPTAIIDTDPIGFSLFTLPDVTTGANVGTGTGLVFRNKVGSTLNFRSLLAGPHVTITNNANDITISTDATSSNTASTIVARDGSGNFSAGTITANLTGSASNNVLKAGDTMTGALQLPAGTLLAPSLNFTGSTTTGLSASSDDLSFSTAATERMKIDASGGVSINGFTTVGVVHNDSAGLLSSSLIVNADVDPAAAIVDTKLATISTAGKVANSATTATSTNTPNTIVLRDGSGNFNAGTIIASLTGSASNNVLKAGDTMTGILQLPAGTTALPSLVFTGSTTTGLSTNSDTLSFSTNALERLRITSGGTINIPAFTSAGVVHNDASGNLSSSLIVNADVAAGAAIVDTKLATISTAGKVANSATTATSANTVSTIVARDGSGNFSAGTITANLSGNATNFTGSLSGDVTGTQSATVVSTVGGQTAANVAAGTVLANAATSADTASAIVRRSAAGGFSTTAISVADEVVSNTLTITPFTSAGVVHNNASGLLSSSLIVNADVDTAAAIVDTKLATISTAGKVANSATTATSANTASAIVARDGSGNFSAGTITANLSGNATTATTATNFSGSLVGDVTGTQGATVVSLVGGQTAANVAAGTVLANASTAANTASTIVRRTATGGFSAGAISVTDEVISSTLTMPTFSTAGIVHNNASGLFSSSLIVNADVDAGAAIVDTKLATISTAGKVANSATTATSANTASAIVARDGSGNFSAGIITADLVGNATTATTATNFSGSLAGEVTGTQGATVVSNAVSANTASAIVRRTATGGFSAGTISVTDAVASGNLVLPTSTSTTGNILKGSNRFIHNFGTNNTFMGVSAGNFTMSGTGANSAFGVSALTANTTGNNNTAIGANALPANTTGAFNTAVGSIALMSNTTGTRNTAIGYSTQSSNTIGTDNTSVGYNALATNTVSSNTAVGSSALFNNTTGTQNTAVGASALTANTTGVSNTALGWSTLSVSTTGIENTAIGWSALKNNTQFDNTAIGYAAMLSNVEGFSNTVVGANALTNSTTGAFNTAVGNWTLSVNAGSNNVAVGSSALTSNTTGTRNIAIGTDALVNNTTGSNNIAVGNDALDGNITGTDNIAIGSNALAVNTVSANIAIGSNALDANTTGDENVGIGHNALGANTTGERNIAIGHSALDANTVGTNNIAIGTNALGSNTTGLFNTAVGSFALDVNTTGINNTAVGTNALGACTTGTDNTAVGTASFPSITSGSNNIAIGNSAGGTLTTGSGNIYINANAAAAAEADTIRIGTSQTVCAIAGISGRTSAAGIAVLVNASNVLGTTTSSIKFKENVENMNDTSDNIHKLRPVTFTYKNDETKTIEYGLIAEEVDEIYPELVARDENDQPYSIRYHVLPALLLNEIQKQKMIINNLTVTIKEMCEAIDSLKIQVKEFIERVKTVENQV